MNTGTGCGICNGDNDNAGTADGNANPQNECCNGEEGDKIENKSEGKLIRYIIFHFTGPKKSLFYYLLFY
jgi:hypothetical protein